MKYNFFRRVDMGKEKRSDARKIADENLSKVFGERLKDLLSERHKGKIRKNGRLSY